VSALLPGYFHLVISIAELRIGVADGRVIFDRTGALVDAPASPDTGPATLLVSEMTDALKTVEAGRITGSIDRAQVWVVEAIVLDREVLDHLQGEVTVEELIGQVREAGFDWQISPTSAP
jgi:hypothetical protein